MEKCVLLITLVIIEATNASFNFIALGDWGASPYPPPYHELDVEHQIEERLGVPDQHRVAARMEQWAGENGIDAIISTGDNFYPEGVVSVDDSRFDDVWKNVYNSSNLENVDWWISLGNHDHHITDGRGLYQVEYSTIEPRWHCPHVWYDHYFEKDDIRMHMIVIDMEVLIKDLLVEYGFTEAQQLEWINDTLANSDWTVDWTILVGHHPVRSCGTYAPGNGYLRNNLAGVFNMYDIDFIINGHDHNMQHITRDDGLGMDFVVNGAGGRVTYGMGERCDEVAEEGYIVDFFQERWGFTGFIVEKDTMAFTHYGDQLDGQDLEELYSYTRQKSEKKTTV